MSAVEAGGRPPHESRSGLSRLTEVTEVDDLAEQSYQQGYVLFLFNCSCDNLPQSVPLATSPKSLSSKYSFGLVKII